jgi:hypothetical protein
MPLLFPKRPALQLLHPAAPPKLNWPAGHGPLQLAEVKFDSPPKRPAAQLVHDVAPAREYLPTGHAPLHVPAPSA